MVELNIDPLIFFKIIEEINIQYVSFMIIISLLIKTAKIVSSTLKSEGC